MSKRLRAVKWSAIVGSLIAIVGIAVPIGWDFWKNRTRVELRQLEEATIVQKQDDLRDLTIMYAGEELQNLTRQRFSLANTGRTPIVGEDLVKPPTITFPKGTRILDAKIEAVYPRGLDARATQLDDSPSVQLEFPLLNQGDNIVFSILIADYSGEPFGATARIVGVGSLTVTRAESVPAKAEKTTHWSIYMVGALTAFLLLGAVGAAGDIREEKAFKRSAAAGGSLLPSGCNKELALRLAPARLSWTTTSERKPLMEHLNGLEDRELSETDRQGIEEMMKLIARSAISNVTAFIVLGLLGTVGAVFVVLSVL